MVQVSSGSRICGCACIVNGIGGGFFDDDSAEFQIGKELVDGEAEDAAAGCAEACCG